MQGITRAIVRLLVMGSVLGGVIAAAVLAGVATTTAIAAGIVLAGIAGLVMAARRPRRSTAADEIAAMMAEESAPRPTLDPTGSAAVEAMAPAATREVDPEANMPRWRRPSLLEARRSDPTRQAPAYRLPMRFTADQIAAEDVRIVRYAVVPILDRPDEVLGRRVADLETGDEVQVLGASGGFLEVHSPNGDRGWLHRTTVGQRQVDHGDAFGLTPQETDEAISGLLSARGMG